MPAVANAFSSVFLAAAASSFAAAMLGSLQLRQLLLQVDAGEEGLALVDGARRQGSTPQLARRSHRYICLLGGADLLGEFLPRSAGMKGVSSMARRYAAISQQVVQHRVPGGRFLRLVLAQHPGGGLVDILVGAGDDLEHLGQRVLELRTCSICSVVVVRAAREAMSISSLVHRVALRAQRAGCRRSISPPWRRCGTAGCPGRWPGRC